MKAKYIRKGERFEPSGIGSLEWAIEMRQKVILNLENELKQKRKEINQSKSRLRALLRLKANQP